MGIANNDYNWRTVAAEDIPENTWVALNTAGKAVKATQASGLGVVGICPQAIASGERCPIMRGGTISGLTGFTAGARLGGDANGAVVAFASRVASSPALAVVKSEDVTLALILSGNLDGFNV